MNLVVDANVFISALLGGRAAELLFDPRFELLTTERTTWEVKKYLPELSDYTERSPADLLLLCELISGKSMPVRGTRSLLTDSAKPDW